MSKRDPKLYLQDISDAISKIEAFTSGVSYDNFVRDEEKMDAIIRNLEVIGEAAKNVPPEIREKYPEIPWEKMTSTRNKVLHEYFGIDMEILWETIQEDIPSLKVKLDNIPGLARKLI
ncbi:MAG: DUF86 domain-containing protein [Patescibacteria group bacterium]|nr:DUF86 domain-containing protein [Patescibacteria group bacterium]MCL5432097.1 DUF86 domain-containing protein [Patescibacteria group bacterium]